MAYLKQDENLKKSGKTTVILPRKPIEVYIGSCTFTAMEVTTLDLVLFLSIFWIMVIFLSSRIDLEKRGMLAGPGVIIWRTERFNRFYKKLSKLFIFQKYSRAIALITISLFFTVPIIFLINLIKSLFFEVSVVLVANPLLAMNVESILLLILPLLMVLTIFELVKGVVAQSEDISVERTGFALVIIFFTVFVQIPKDQLRKLPKVKRLKVLGMPILFSLFLALLFIPILYAAPILSQTLYHPSSGALVMDVYPDTPAYAAGIERGDVITGINYVRYGFITQRLNITSTNELMANLREIAPNTEFVLVFTDRSELIKGIKPPDGSQIKQGSYLGFDTIDYREPRIGFLGNFLPIWIETMIKWFININIAFSLFNLLPLPFTDGGKFYELLMESVSLSEKQEEYLTRIVVTLAAALGLANLAISIF